MSFNFSPKTVSDGLVIYLDAGNAKSYVNGSANWNDISRNENNGTLVNGTTFSSVNCGSILFDGIDDYVQIENSTTLNLTQDGGSVSAWFRTGVIGSGSIGGSLVAKTNTYNNGYWLTKYNDKVRISLHGSSVSFRLQMVGVTSIADNIWHQAVATWTTSQVNLYVDGVLDSTQSYTFSFATSTDPLYLGRQKNVGELYFDGKISTAQIYNRALSATEVLQNYNSTKTRFI